MTLRRLQRYSQVVEATFRVLYLFDWKYGMSFKEGLVPNIGVNNKYSIGCFILDSVRVDISYLEDSLVPKMVNGATVRVPSSFQMRWLTNQASYPA